jgi:hypothetical protein
VIWLVCDADEGEAVGCPMCVETSDRVGFGELLLFGSEAHPLASGAGSDLSVVLRAVGGSRGGHRLRPFNGVGPAEGELSRSRTGGATTRHGFIL